MNKVNRFRKEIWLCKFAKKKSIVNCLHWVRTMRFKFVRTIVCVCWISLQIGLTLAIQLGYRLFVVAFFVIPNTNVYPVVKVFCLCLNFLPSLVSHHRFFGQTKHVSYFCFLLQLLFKLNIIDQFFLLAFNQFD